MNILKKDQSRSEIILIIGVIVLLIIVIGRFFGAEIAGFFFGAGANLEIAGTSREGELDGKSVDKSPTQPEISSGRIDFSTLDPSLHGDEDAIARLIQQREQEKRERVKKAVFWALALCAFLVVLGLIVWKFYTIFREIKIKNLQE